MPIYHQLIALCWVALVAYWIISAFGIKRTKVHNSHRWWFRIIVVVFVFAIFNIPALDGFTHFRVGLLPDALSGTIGVALCAVGVAFAIWARAHLGVNWGLPGSLKENPDLVMTGPYTYVRHPIYLGVLAALLGTAFVAGVPWLVPLAFVSLYFFLSAHKEDTILEKQFPGEFPDYRKRTRMILPFVF